MTTINPIPNYSRTVLYQNNFFEIVSIEWNKSSASPIHNHGWSQCLVLVEEGIFENTLDMGIKTELQLLEKGQVLRTPVGAKHALRCMSNRGKTLHIYTPKIQAHTEEGQFFAKPLERLKRDLQLNEPTRVDHLQEILNSIREHSISTHSPYFMNQLFSGILPQMLLAENLIAQTKTTLATFEASPAFSSIEQEVVETLASLIGWEKNQREGINVPGGSAANFMALHCARQKFLPEIKQRGMQGDRFKIYVSNEAHYSIKKACVVLGFGTESLVVVPADRAGRMDTRCLEKLVQEDRAQGAIPLLVVSTAGTTVYGAFDPIAEISEICNRHRIWHHVDGAWGGPALFSKKLRKLLYGIELADSMTFDAHKLFGASLTSSFFLTKHKGLLLEANDISGADYLFHSEDQNLDRGKLSWQCGRSAEATSFWTIWKSVGTDGLGEFIDRLVAIREEAVEWIKSQSRLELIASPEYLNICVRIQPPHSNKAEDWSKQVREKLKESNLCLVNYANNAEGSFLRLILANPYLNFMHIKQILSWALEIS